MLFCILIQRASAEYLFHSKIQTGFVMRSWWIWRLVTPCEWGACVGHHPPVPSTPQQRVKPALIRSPFHRTERVWSLCRPPLHTLSLPIRKAWEMKRSSTTVLSHLFLSGYPAHASSGTRRAEGNKWIWGLFKREMTFFLS